MRRFSQRLVGGIRQLGRRNAPTSSAASWDAEAERFDEAADHGLADAVVRAAWRSLLLELLPPAPARVADLGCGTGTLTRLLAEHGYAVDGVDFSAAMVQRAVAKTREFGSVTISQADADRPPLRTGSYDAVLSRHVLWAMPDPASTLGRWQTLLRPGGSLVLVEGRWSTGAGLTSEQVVALLHRAGRDAHVRRLDDARYWGEQIADERFAVLSP